MKDTRIVALTIILGLILFFLSNIFFVRSEFVYTDSTNTFVDKRIDRIGFPFISSERTETATLADGSINTLPLFGNVFFWIIFSAGLIFIIRKIIK